MRFWRNTVEVVGGQQQNRSLGTQFVTRFPVTLALAVEYCGLAVLPARQHHNPATGFIVWITAVGVCAAFVVEAAAPTPRPAPRPDTAISVQAGIALIVVGIASSYIQSRTSGQTFGSLQTEPSHFSALLSPLRQWTLLGCACLLAAWRSGQISYRKLAALLIAVEAVWGWYCIQVIGRSAPFMAFSLALATGALLTGFVRARVVAALAISVFVLWPTIAQFRNATRARQSGVEYTNYDAKSRIREDLLLRAASTTPVPMHIGQPSLLTAARFGLLPRILDNRDSLRTTRELSVAFGSNDTSSYGLTILGTARAFTGTSGMVFLVAGVAAAVRVLRSRDTPFRLALVMTVFQALIWIESTYPDGIAGVLQATVSMGAVLLACRAWAIRRSPAAFAPVAVRA